MASKPAPDFSVDVVEVSSASGSAPGCLEVIGKSPYMQDANGKQSSSRLMLNTDLQKENITDDLITTNNTPIKSISDLLCDCRGVCSHKLATPIGSDGKHRHPAKDKKRKGNSPLDDELKKKGKISSKNNGTAKKLGRRTKLSQRSLRDTTLFSRSKYLTDALTDVESDFDSEPAAEAEEPKEDVTGRGCQGQDNNNNRPEKNSSMIEDILLSLKKDFLRVETKVDNSMASFKDVIEKRFANLETKLDVMHNRIVEAENVIPKVAELEENLKEMKNNISSDIDKKVRDAISDVDKEISSSIEFQIGEKFEIEAKKCVDESLRDELDALKASCLNAEIRLNSHEKHISGLNHYSYAKNIRIGGFERKDGSERRAYEIISEAFRIINIDVNQIPLSTFHFAKASKRIQGRVFQEVILAPLRKSDVYNILRRASDYNNTLQQARVQIFGDSEPRVRANSPLVRRILRACSIAGFPHAKVVDYQTNILINNKKYAVTNLIGLPPSVFNVLRSFDENCSENAIAFYGNTSPFSNFLPCKLNLNGIDFRYSERLYFMEVARLFGNKELGKELLELDSPGQIKKRAESFISELNGDDRKKWEEVKYSAMLNAIRIKFNSNLILRGLLLATGNKTLIEASHDTTWGSGIRLWDNNSTSTEFPGYNWLGEIIMQVRDEIRSGKRTIPVNPANFLWN